MRRLPRSRRRPLRAACPPTRHSSLRRVLFAGREQTVSRSLITLREYLLMASRHRDTLRCHRAHCHQQQQMPGQSSLEQQPPLLPFQTPYPSPPQTYELPRRRSTQDPIAAVPGPSSIYAIPSPNSSGTRRKSEVYALPTPPSRTISTDRQLHQRARQLPPLVQSTVVNLIRFAQEFPGTGEGSERTQKAGERPVSWEEALQGLRAAVQRVEKVEGYRSNECAGVGL